ncbi:uncharacterized protein LOC126474359, partial [Schistocerca serialis cubense]|uniref:uncharacterized protein LOC126474359 n=1 Tax=Schistocerca serialis cubense TaxID=2023355 RepID=UPI00214EB6C9
GSKKKKAAAGHAPSPATPTADPELSAQHRPRARREPLPMKLRALPQSFWQQPNAAGGLSPGAVYPVLPPLCCKDDDGAGLRPATPPEERDKRRVVSVANTELLFSLFRSVEQLDQPAARVARRGRPKKVAATSWRLPRDEDPCLVSAVADPILPLIRGHAGGQHQVLATVSLGAGERSVVLPSLSVEHNYSQILSELVMKL